MWLKLISKYKKPLIWLVVILGIAGAVYFWKRKTDSQKAIGDLTVDKTNLTITNNQAIIIAENILGAMNRYGTDEKVIIDNLKTLRKNDLLLVMKQFGVRPYNGAGLATRGYEKQFFSTDLNLIGWLQEELSGDSLDQVANIFLNNQIPF
ncbi:MAG: hypothetical protein Q8R96_11705 [Bacteroidota bacterium]|nr:hypothetical protein [Bacteroidota bacterium]